MMKEIKIKLGSLLSFLTVFAVVCSFTTAFAKNPVEIDIMHRWAGPRNVPFQKIIDNFLAKNPGVKVENIVVPGVYTNLETKILARAAAGEEPPSIIAPGYYLLLHSAETFDPVVLGEMEGAEVVFSDFLPATLELGQIDNVQWALPFALSNPILFYNSKIFEQAGLDPNDPPRTWREVYLVSKIIKDMTKITAPVWPQILDTYFPQSLIESNGGHMVKNGRAAFNSPEGIEAVRMWQELYKEGLSPKVKWDEGIEGFKFSKIAIEITSPSLIPIFAEAVPSVKTGEFPTFGSKPRRLASGGGCLMITAKNPEKRKAAWDLMKHMVSKQSMKDRNTHARS